MGQRLIWGLGCWESYGVFLGKLGVNIGGGFRVNLEAEHMLPLTNL